MRLMQETVQELRHVSQFHRRDDLRMHAYSALDVCCRRVLNEFMLVERTLYYDPGARVGESPSVIPEISPLDPAVKWSISLVDESGKGSNISNRGEGFGLSLLRSCERRT